MPHQGAVRTFAFAAYDPGERRSKASPAGPGDPRHRLTRLLWWGDEPELRARGYIPTKGLLEPSLARVVYKTLLLQQWRGECFRDNHVPTAVA